MQAGFVIIVSVDSIVFSLYHHHFFLLLLVEQGATSQCICLVVISIIRFLFYRVGLLAPCPTFPLSQVGLESSRQKYGSWACSDGPHILFCAPVT